jgi:hypothetical protein
MKKRNKKKEKNIGKDNFGENKIKILPEKELLYFIKAM